MIENEKIAVSYSRVSPTKHDRVSPTGEKLSHFEVQEKIHKSLLSSIKTCDDAAKRDGFEINHVYYDEYISGKNQDNMIAFREMMEAARAGEFNILYVRRSDRLGRNMNESYSSIIELDRLGIVVKSVEESLDTSTPIGKGVIAFMLSISENQRIYWEKSRIAGVKRARAAGIKFGRKAKDIDVKLLRQMRLLPLAERPSWERLEIQNKCSRVTMIKKLKAAGYWDYEQRCVK
ncbi:MAG: recombinase family protein [Eubacteriales bacterium]